jgi:hypothetical protein
VSVGGIGVMVCVSVGGIGVFVSVNVAVCGRVGVKDGVMVGVQVEKTVGVNEGVLVGVTGVAVRLGGTVWVENGDGEGEKPVVGVGL